MTLLGVDGDPPPCSCGAPEGAPHSITCMTVAATQPNAMVNGDGDVFYPDNPEDAAYFTDQHAAAWLHGRPPDGWRIR